MVKDFLYPDERKDQALEDCLKKKTEKCEVCTIGMAVDSRGPSWLAYENEKFIGVAFLYCPMCGHKNKQFEER
jgi:rubrerythrin